MTAPPEKPFRGVPSADPGKSDLELARHLLACTAQMRHLCSGVPVRDVNAAAMAQVMTEFDATMAELIRRGNQFAVFLGIADAERKATAA